MTAQLNLLKIYKLFNFEINGQINENVIKTLQDWLLIPKENEYQCPRNHPLKLCQKNNVIDGYVWRCNTKSSENKKKPKKCNYEISIRKDTFFSKSHLPMFKIVSFSYLWLQNTTQDFIINEIEIHRDTAVDWANFCREVVYYGVVQNKCKIGGESMVVEIDESKFGKRKYHRGHRVEGQWVFGGVERQTGRCFLIPVEKRDTNTLLEIIKDWILPGTTIVSDCWKAYDCLNNEGFVHYKVNHSLTFKDPETGEHTNTIEGLWRHAKHSMPQYHRKKQFFSGYLAKFMFIKSCKSRNLDSLVEFFKMAGSLYNPYKPYNLETTNNDDDESEYDVEITNED